MNMPGTFNNRLTSMANKTYINGSTPLLELHLCKTQFQVKMAVKMMTLYQRELRPGVSPSPAT